MTDFNHEFSRIIQALQLSQKKGLFNLDEAAAVHSSIINIQKMDLQKSENMTTPIPNGPSVQEHHQLVNERDTLVNEKDLLVNERNTLVNERNTLVNEKNSLMNERCQLVSLLEEYKNAIEEFKKQHDEQLFHLQTEKERNKELKMKMNMLEKENIDLKNDLTELVNSDPGEDDEDELIPVVSNKKK
tara:strand:- start:424 stop:984 length:561 start_codon:yes stop_codon:yes gene_type:complete